MKTCESCGKSIVEPQAVHNGDIISHTDICPECTIKQIRNRGTTSNQALSDRGASTASLSSNMSRKSSGPHLGLMYADWTVRESTKALQEHPVPSSSSSNVCAGCCFYIDSAAVRALDRLWHAECFVCTVCGTPLFLEEDSSDEDDDNEHNTGGGGTKRRHNVNFLQIGDLPYCREHFLQQQRLREVYHKKEKHQGRSSVEKGEGEEGEGDPIDWARFLTGSSSGLGEGEDDDDIIVSPYSVDEVFKSNTSDGSYQTAVGGGAAKVGTVASSSSPARLVSAVSSSASLPRFPSEKSVTSSTSSSLAAAKDTAACDGMPRRRSNQQLLLHRLESTGIASKETIGEKDERVRSHAKLPTSLFALEELVPETWQENHAPPRMMHHPLEDVMNGEGGRASSTFDDDTITRTSPHYSPRTPPEAPPSPPPLTKNIALSYAIQVVGQTGAQLPDPTTNITSADRCKERRQLHLLYNGSLFYWEEAVPLVFRQIRETFGIDRRQYKASMARLEDEQAGLGRSGSLFFRTHDNLLLIKTMTEAEHTFLLSTLKDYLDFVSERGSESLLPHFYGLYTIKLPGQPPCRLVVMNNIFHRCLPRMKILQKYDLKGSLIKRFVREKEDEQEDEEEKRIRHNGLVLKDLNFCPSHDGTDDDGHEFKGTEKECRSMYFGDERRKQLMDCLMADVEWLKEHNVMDYSLLIGLCSIQESSYSSSSFTVASSIDSEGGAQEGQQQPQQQRSVVDRLKNAPDEASRHKFYSLWMPSYDDNEDGQQEGGRRDKAQKEEGDVEDGDSVPSRRSSNKANHLPLFNSNDSSHESYHHQQQQRSKTALSPSDDMFASTKGGQTREVYLLGLVDILQVYGLKKRMETMVKTGYYYSSGTDPKGLSVINPEQYGARFLEFIDKHTS